MEDLKNMICRKIDIVIPDYEKLELNAYVSERVYDVEFFVTICGERFQNYQMVDNDRIDADEMDRLVDEIADCIRKSEKYIEKKECKVSFELMK